MSREIKFRALRNGKTWWYSSDDGIYFKDGYLYEFDDIDIDSNIGIAYQYTELKDTSEENIEVYDGDIISFSYGIPPIRVNAEVKFIDGAFMVLTPGHRPEMSDLQNLYSYVGDFEVVGNIHENPELLDQS